MDFQKVHKFHRRSAACSDIIVCGGRYDEKRGIARYEHYLPLELLCPRAHETILV